MKLNVSALNLIVLICTYPRIILKFIRSSLTVGFKPTTFAYLMVLLVYQRMQFSKLEILHDADRIRICLMIADSSLADNSKAF